MLNIDKLKTERMDKKDICYWRDKYNTNSSEGNKIEQEVGKNLRKNKKLSLKELKSIIQWKYPNVGARGNLKRADKIPNGAVELITETALKIKDDKYRVNILTTLDGVGIATASAILAFYDPENYGVGDRYIMADFFGKPEDKT